MKTTILSAALASTVLLMTAPNADAGCGGGYYRPRPYPIVTPLPVPILPPPVNPAPVLPPPINPGAGQLPPPINPGASQLPPPINPGAGQLPPAVQPDSGNATPAPLPAPTPTDGSPALPPRVDTPSTAPTAGMQGVDFETILTGFEKAEPPALDPAIAPLVGLWKTAARQADGTVKTIELEIMADGQARLTVPAGGPAPASMQRQLLLQDQQLMLSDGQSNLVLGTLIQADQQEMLLQRDGGRIRFTRP